MKRIFTLAFLLLALLPLRAQVATVEVSRPYDVNLDGIRKPEIPIFIDDSLHRFDVHFDYTIFNRPYNDLYDFTPYESIQLATVMILSVPKKVLSRQLIHRLCKIVC